MKINTLIPVKHSSIVVMIPLENPKRKLIIPYSEQGLKTVQEIGYGATPSKKLGENKMLKSFFFIECYLFCTQNETGGLWKKNNNSSCKDRIST